MLAAALLALPAVSQAQTAPQIPQDGDYQYLGRSAFSLLGQSYAGEVGIGKPGKVQPSPRGAGFGQNPREGFYQSQDYPLVRMKLTSFNTKRQVVKEAVGGFRVSLIDLCDQGLNSDCWIILTADKLDAKHQPILQNGKPVRYVPKGGAVHIAGGPNPRWESNLTIASYTGYLVRPVLEVWTEQGKVGSGALSARGAPGFGDGHLFQIATLEDCPPWEANAMKVERWTKTAQGYAAVPAAQARTTIGKLPQGYKLP